MIKIEGELNEKKNFENFKNNIEYLKKENLLINKYKEEVKKLKKELNENEEFFDSDEKIRIKKNKKIDELNKINDRYKQEIQKLKKKLNDKDDDKNKEEEIYTDMPYLETEKEAAERIVDFHEEKGKGYVDFPILLSRMYTSNSSKELKTNIKKLLNHLCDNKQITKQV